MNEEIKQLKKEKQIGYQKSFVAREHIIRSDFAIHFHDYYELEIVAEGRGVMTLNGNDIPFSAGNVFFITPNDFHSYKSCDNTRIYNISFGEEIIFEGKSENKILEKTESVLSVNSKLLSALVTISKLMMNLNNTSVDSEAYLLKSIFTLLPNFYEVRRSHSYTHNATAFIENHFKENLTASEVANHCNINADYLNKLFKKELNSTVTDYIRKIRIEYADILLKNTDLPVSQVAFSSGFQSIQTFNRVYKQRYGVSPTVGKKSC